MPSAEIITIGTELLLGEIVDTNSAYLARKLRDLGVDIFRTSTVGDNTQRISEVIRETLARTQIIITTGGLGPTVDDPTRDAVALAMGVETEFHPELWEQVVARLGRFGRKPSENQKKQAYIPRGAIAIQNPVGTAPGFIFEQGDKTIISLPGVPREMEYLIENSVLPYLRTRYQLRGTIKARVLHTSGVGEGQIDEWISDLEFLTNPSVGLAAGAGKVDVRITAKAESIEEADALIADMEARIRERLKEAVFGADGDTLEGVTLNLLQERGWSLAVVEAGLSGALIQIMSQAKSNLFLGGELMASLSAEDNLVKLVEAERSNRNAQVAIGISLSPGTEQQEVNFYFATPDDSRQHKRIYGGHPRYAPQWAVSLALDMLRRMLLK